MSSSREYRDLGMGRKIPRRDFLNGVAVGVAGILSSGFLVRGSEVQVPPRDAATYPPARAGLRGNYPDAVSAFGPMGQGAYRQFPALDPGNDDTRDIYDLVIVGAGISGLAAAHLWRRALGANQKILILDNHDDFGGHAKRNEFTYQGRTFVGYGGTQSIATPFPYSYTAKRLLEELTIQVERNGEFQNRGPLGTLGPAMFFDKEHFGEDRLVQGSGRLPWPEFFAKAPLSDAARADLIRIYGKNPDYMAGMTAEQKLAKLAAVSWQDFLLRHAKMTPEALPFFLGQGGRNNKRVDTTPALEAAERGSVGFNGLGLKFEEAFRENSYTFHFPDGNASIARLLVNRLIPGALPGRQTMETIVQAPLAYERLDEPASEARIRLKSTVVRVEHDLPSGSAQASPDRAQSVRVAYRRDGKIHGVRGRRVILACYNSLIPSLVPDLPAKQKDALAYSVKVPMMYNNVLIRRWTAFQRLGASNISAPGMYHTSCGLDPGTSIGGYRGVTTADEPIVVRMVRNPNKPGLPRREQHRAGQQELLSMSFEQFELEIRRQLGRMLAGGGFDPAADIVGITVNRWPHGYSYTYDTLGDPDVAPEDRPHVVGRRRFGRIAIANSDAGAAAFTNQAIDEANRAVEELFVAEGLA